MLFDHNSTIFINILWVTNSIEFLDFKYSQAMTNSAHSCNFAAASVQ